MLFAIGKSLRCGSVNRYTHRRLGIQLAALFLASSALAGAGAGAGPAGLTGQMTPSASLTALEIPSLDAASLLEEDQNRVFKGLPFRFAVAKTIRITPQSAGRWDQLPDGTNVWRVRITSPNATSLSLKFARFHLPPQSSAFLYSPDGLHQTRALTSADNKPRRGLLSPLIPGDQIILEIAIPENVRSQLELEIESVNVGYRSPGDVEVLSGACNVDVACPQASPWQDQVQSVALLAIDGVNICTGTMMNNTARDGLPLFLTANHCGVTAANAPDVVVYWNFQNSTCREPGSTESGQTGDGTYDDFQLGATWLASYAPSDFTLIELDQAPNPAWDVSFAGWDRSDNNTQSSVGIHHPGTDEKRISFDFDPSEITPYLSSSGPGDASHLRVVDWDLGTTEAGSSGSPLFDQNHRVVGQLHGGFTACGNNDSIWYGRLMPSWDGGGTSDARLSDWLDPLQTGEAYIDHLFAGALTVTPSGDVLHIGTVGGPFTNPIRSYMVSNWSTGSLDYRVTLTQQFGLLLNSGTAPVTGTLNAGEFVNIEASVGPALNDLPAGVYIENVQFEDLTNGVIRTRRHTVEVGQTLFTVTPSQPLISGGPAGGPFPDSRAYTVTNQRPTPVQVEVAASQNWISINGESGPITLDLPSGDSQNVTVGFGPAAEELPVGDHSGEVTFENLSGGSGDTSRAVTLDVGRIVHSATDVPQGINDFKTTMSVIEVPVGRCIFDLNVDVDILHSYIGDLVVDLTSPAGTVVRMHNSTGGPADNIILTYDDEGDAPDGPGSLSDFDGEFSGGEWTLSVTDNGFPDSGSLRAWSISIEPAPGDCITPQRIHDFPMDTDPGWARQGLWSFGQPTGGGTHNRDPSAGYDGNFAFGYNLNGDYPNNMSTPHNLTTGAIDCSNIADTTLVFRRWLGVDSANSDRASVQISTNGINWTTLWQNPTFSIAETSWSRQAFDISAFADGQSNVFIRWVMGTTNASITYPGWNIDEVEIWGLPTSGPCNASSPPGVCCIAEPPLAEPQPLRKNRYISIQPTNDGRQTALRVRLNSLHHPDPPNHPFAPSQDFSSYEGEYRWVGPPSIVTDSELQQTSLTVAGLQCQPHFAEWNADELLHIYGVEIVPDSVYEIQAVVSACGLNNEMTFSEPVFVTTNRWGDPAPPFQAPSPASLSQPNIGDISMLVDKFKDVGSSTKAQTQLAGNSVTPKQPVNISDIAATVDAFKGFAYPYQGPDDCAD